VNKRAEMPVWRWTAPVDGKRRRLRLEPTSSGWYVASDSGVEIRLTGCSDGLICRIRAKEEDKDVVQLGIGETTSRLCNAIFLPQCDTAFEFEGDNLDLRFEGGGSRRCLVVRTDGPLTITRYADYMKAHRGLRWFRPLDRSCFPRPPAGWCSWYYYYLGIDEAETIRNTDWLAENLKPFGCEWVQIDDGWQDKGSGYGLNRDFFKVCAEKFPRGMKFLADYIRSKGLRPGIWCIPFFQSDSTLERSRPGVYIRLPDGSSPGELNHPNYMPWMRPENERYVDWCGRYCIDPTGMSGQRYLADLAEQLCVNWGYEYVKIDAQGGMSALLRRHRRWLADPSHDGDRSYRTGLLSLKKVMGPGRFLLNCGSGWDSVGLCEGIRIGGDVQANWNGVLEAARCTLRWLWLNTTAFYTDPDVVCVRHPLSFDQARVWTTLVGITGQLLMTSDKMYELPEDRVELLRRVFPVADIHPMELYPLDPQNKPRIFDLKVNKPGVGVWDVVAVFNWDEKDTQEFTIGPERLGLSGDSWLVVDAHAGIIVNRGSGQVTFQVAPMSCHLLVWQPLADHPQVVGTSRHLTQGAVDLEAVRWNDKTAVLSGISRVVGRDDYQIRFTVPPGWAVKTGGVQVDRGMGVLTLRSEENRTVNWAIRFRRARRMRKART